MLIEELSRDRLRMMERIENLNIDYNERQVLKDLTLGEYNNLIKFLEDEVDEIKNGKKEEKLKKSFNLINL